MTSIERTGDIILEGSASADAEHISEVKDLTKVERRWLAGKRRYADNIGILRGAWAGELVLIEASDNFRPLARFLAEPNQRKGLTPFLKPEAAKVLDVFGALWREIASQDGVDPAAKLSLTSFVRSMDYQRKLSERPGKLALSPEASSHPTGWAFDVDSSSYYLDRADELPLSVSRRDRREQEELHNAVKRHLGNLATPTLVAAPDMFDRSALDSLHKTANILHVAGIINRVVEFADTANECIHICVNPQNFSASGDVNDF